MVSSKKPVRPLADRPAPGNPFRRSCAGRVEALGRLLPALILTLSLFSGSLIAAPAPGPAPAGKEPRKEVVPGPTQAELMRRPLPKLILERGQIHLRYARELLGEGRHAAALEQLDRFLVLYPRHPWRFYAFRDRARLLERVGRQEQAIASYEAAYLEAHNRERGARAYLRAGRLLAELGRSEQARRIFLTLIRRRPASRAARLAEIELKALRFLDAGHDSPDSAPGDRSSSETKKPSGSDAPGGAPAGKSPTEPAPAAPVREPAGEQPAKKTAV